jgi:hypothetical protein
MKAGEGLSMMDERPGKAFERWRKQLKDKGEKHGERI